jgi:hypothetical protein
MKYAENKLIFLCTVISLLFTGRSTYSLAGIWLLALSRNPQHFMELEGSLPCSQELATKPDEFYMYCTRLHLSPINFCMQ